MGNKKRVIKKDLYKYIIDENAENNVIVSDLIVSFLQFIGFPSIRETSGFYF